ncbi:uncharacterized protein LOC117171156 [Belonocnema kinseyi]|uniref:uncharacterized protein LOC117171156 n=1 Tax=Belonocnema kinseyi TaxID=2817044 RepID=UPI00143D4410|nr:uncharacterized protein LOC117171156 [Belonocnema kinseyi]
MGSLPNFRTTLSRPFTHTRVDYAGPFNVRVSPGRGQKSYKCYVALFVCCVSRAIHLELVSNYYCEAFLAAYNRFTNRCGLPAHMYSDNGTTFQGAERDLRNCLLNLRKDLNLQNQLVSQGSTWHFIPPSAPHFGGMWEAGATSFKHHFRRIVGSRTLTFEELYTTLTRIEAALNSRPIRPLSDNSEDLTYLTPGHFLIGAPLLSPPEQSVEFVSENRLSRWQVIQQIVETFRRRWATEYLHCLQRRYMWTREQSNLKIDDLVLMRNDGLPPTKWSLARVIKCYPGKDGLVR